VAVDRGDEHPDCFRHTRAKLERWSPRARASVPGSIWPEAETQRRCCSARRRSHKPPPASLDPFSAVGGSAGRRAGPARSARPGAPSGFIGWCKSEAPPRRARRGGAAARSRPARGAGRADRACAARGPPGRRRRAAFATPSSARSTAPRDAASRRSRPCALCDPRRLQPLRRRLDRPAPRDREPGRAAAAETLAKQQIPRDRLTIHADRGSAMRSKPVAFLLADRDARLGLAQHAQLVLRGEAPPTRALGQLGVGHPRRGRRQRPRSSRCSCSAAIRPGAPWKCRRPAPRKSRSPVARPSGGVSFVGGWARRPLLSDDQRAGAEQPLTPLRSSPLRQFLKRSAHTFARSRDTRGDAPARRRCYSKWVMHICGRHSPLA